MKTYAITGSASGIGASITQHLIENGHKVIQVDRNNATIEADLSSAQGRQQAIEQIIQQTSDGLDGFVPCAGLGAVVKPASLIVKVNYFGAIQMVESLKPYLKQSSSVVMIASTSAPMANDTQAIDLMLANEEDSCCRHIDDIGFGVNAYSASKHAICRWTRNHAPDYARAGIRLNAIAPGHVNTPLSTEIEKDALLGEAIKAYVQATPLGRSGNVDDIAHLVLFLLSDKASYMSGSVIFNDGGHDAMLRPDKF